MDYSGNRLARIMAKQDIGPAGPNLVKLRQIGELVLL
jgi:hypothetical protein